MMAPAGPAIDTSSPATPGPATSFTVLEPCTARFAAASCPSSTSDGRKAKAETPNTSAQTPHRKVTTARNGTLSHPPTQAMGIWASSTACAAFDATMTRRWSRPSRRLPATSENSRYGSVPAAATAPTSPGPASSVIAVTSGTAKTVTWLPAVETVWPNQ